MKNIKALTSVPICAISSFAILTSTSCSANTINFANWESYIDPSAMAMLHKNYNVQFLNFSTNEDVESKFKTNYDAAVPSVYEMLVLLKKGQLAEINWPDYDLRYKVEENWFPVENGTDALNLTSDSTQDMIESINEYADENDYFPTAYTAYMEGQGLSPTILDFGLPYFISQLGFSYKGEIIDDLTDGIVDNGDGSDGWKTVTDYISPKSDDFDERFAPSNRSKVLITDDERTYFGLCNSYYTDGGSINPDGKNRSIDYYNDCLEPFSENFKGTHSLKFNSDGGILSELYTDLQYNNGIISYTGDIAASMVGYGDDQSMDEWNDIWEDAVGDDYDGNYSTDYTEWPVHTVIPNKSELALDICIFNKKNATKEADGRYILKSSGNSKAKSINNLARDMILDGVDHVDENDVPQWWIDAGHTEDDWPIYSYDDNDDFIYIPMIDLDFVQYYSPYKSIADTLNCDLEDFDPTNVDDSAYAYFFECNGAYDWWDEHRDDANATLPKYFMAWTDYLQTTLNLYTDDGEDNSIAEWEYPLGDLDKSNLHWSYVAWKEKLN